jgi:hypothetical protein
MRGIAASFYPRRLMRCAFQYVGSAAVQTKQTKPRFSPRSMMISVEDVARSHGKPAIPDPLKPDQTRPQLSVTNIGSWRNKSMGQPFSCEGLGLRVDDHGCPGIPSSEMQMSLAIPSSCAL